ncbi:hypothetical protein [uncultured Phenylobacterium sp.]|uniref:hypothetical protein n=1 Tax=uncultured Phenylobacterium sp. TaxID=349273 RepID=UPI0025F0532C|nr:hypothetical protein [uncultured Phenylobacterium sp.]
MIADEIDDDEPHASRLTAVCQAVGAESASPASLPGFVAGHEQGGGGIVRRDTDRERALENWIQLGVDSTPASA